MPSERICQQKNKHIFDKKTACQDRIIHEIQYMGFGAFGYTIYWLIMLYLAKRAGDGTYRTKAAWRSVQGGHCNQNKQHQTDTGGKAAMTREKREFAEMLGLLDLSRHPEIEQDKRLALRYLNSGANIPQTLLYRIERVSMMDGLPQMKEA